MLGPIELLVWAFDEEDIAGEALKELHVLEQQKIIAVINAAVLTKNVEGKTHLHETQDVDAKRGALFGAIMGGLIGLLGGPAGAIVGAAAGAATGGFAAHEIDLGFDSQFLEDLENSLKPGSSALLALVEHEWVDRLVKALDDYKGRLFTQSVKAEIASQLAEQALSGTEDQPSADQAPAQDEAKKEEKK